MTHVVKQIMPENVQPEARKRDFESYSIISKRCVEKLYYPNEPSFYKPFVSKFKRRAPLINRGYWLRMKAVDSAIEAFLQQPTDKKIVVLNLGCGYDPLSFRMRWKWNAKGVKFVDIDNKELIMSKVKIFTQNKQLHQHLHDDLHITNKEDKDEDEDENIIFSSESYLAVGCELTEVDVLYRIFNEIVQIQDCEIMFLAEFSTTYMPDHDIEALLQWTATFENAHFCLLDHYLPDGPDHPFAKAMLHRVGMQVPLHSPLRFSTLSNKRDQFQRAGWESVDTQSLWDFWQNSSALTREEMLQLNRVEPFDDWEDFALFSGHHFILQASTRPRSPVEEEQTSGKRDLPVLEDLSVSEPYVSYKPSPKPTRFAAPLVLSPKSASIQGGTLGSQNSEVYTCRASVSLIPPVASQSLLCHTITTVGPTHHLLIGGRSSPTKVSSRCLVYDSDTNNWTRVQDIYPARHRHCATSISIGALHCVLVFGGCTIGGKVLDDWQLWDKDHGWRKLQTECGSEVLPRFGSSLIATGSAHGILMGGMEDTGRITVDAFGWCINETLSIKFRPISHSGAASVARFGASIVPSRWGNLLVGGVSSLGVISKEEEILVLTQKGEARPLKVFTESVPRPLLVGAITVPVAGGDILITGGGAVCFSFGSVMNGHWYTIQEMEQSGGGSQEDSIPQFQRLTKDDLHSRNPLSAGAALKSFRQSQRTKTSENNYTGLELPRGPPRRPDSCYSTSRSFLVNSSDVTKVRSTSVIDSRIISDFSKPTLLLLKEGAFARTTEWNLDFLAAKIGRGTPVSIHDSQGPHMKFAGKGRNIKYNSVPFGHFKILLDHGYHCYLRSLNRNSSLEEPADFWRDFPGLRDDFKLPSFLKDAFGISDTTFHSAILRVSGDVTMWVHYDVMSNLLFQVSGSKQVLLFPPEDVIKLGFEPGKTASPLNVFEELEKRHHGNENERLTKTSLDFLNGARPHGVILREGEVLFIPRFWAHATAPDAASPPSIAINVFWRDLDPKSYSSRSDVYGNLDLWCYEQGRQKIQRAATILCGNANILERKNQAATISQHLQGRETSDQTEIPDLRGIGLDGLRKLVRADVPTDVSDFYLLRLGEELVKLVEQDDEISSWRPENSGYGESSGF